MPLSVLASPFQVLGQYELNEQRVRLELIPMLSLLASSSSVAKRAVECTYYNSPRITHCAES